MELVTKRFKKLKSTVRKILAQEDCLGFVFTPRKKEKERERIEK